MKLISTTLSANSADVIGDALKSVVDLVDQCLLIDTGITDGTLDLAREVCGDKLVVRQFEWTADFSAARNFSLDAAAELGGDWALTLDSDERLQGTWLGPSAEPEAVDAIRHSLTRLMSEPVGVIYVPDVGRHYVKERFFRLPSKERWKGPTHEAFAAYKVGHRTFDMLSFSELPKSAEASRRKFERDVEILSRHVEQHPTDPRWHYYLGESHRNLGQHEQAVRAHDACAALRGWNEESAFACFRAAQSLCALERHEEALERCAVGLARHAGIAELAWLAGFVCYQLGRDEQAIYWSRLALVHGLAEGDGATVPRIGFKEPVGLWEGPYDVLRWAEKRRGSAEAAATAERQWQEAQQRRQKS